MITASIIADSPQRFQDECLAYMQAGYTICNPRSYLHLRLWPLRISRLWVAEYELDKTVTFREPTHGEVNYCVEVKLEKAIRDNNPDEIDRLLEELNNLKKVRK